MTLNVPPDLGEIPAGVPPAVQDLFRKVLAPDAPQPLKMTAARGALPLPRNLLLNVLVSLAADPDAEVARAAADSLDEFQSDPDRLSEILEPETTAPAVLAHFARSSGAPPEILRIIVIHPGTPLETLVELASRVTGDVLESLLLNENRLSANPDILVAMKGNPHLSPRQKNRIEEITLHLVRPHPAPSRPEPVAAPPEPETPAGPDAAAEAGPRDPDDGQPQEPWELPAEALPQDLAAAPAEEDYPEEAGGLAADRIARMNVAEKIQLAMTADREERMILVRDRNKTVSTSVLKSPKVNEKDVAVFAAMRNVDVEVLRNIGRRRDWLKSYAVALALVENPKTPVGLALQLVKRLNNKDLKFLARNRNISDTIRRSAHRTFQTRTMPAKTDLRGKK